jgi:DEAD/DEAH box helicase domain-containing protein
LSALCLRDGLGLHGPSVYPQERREIERALFEGSLSAVAATNALELGIDVGSLDVTLHLGFPGTVASLRQQVRLARPHGGGSKSAAAGAPLQ